MGMTLPDKNTLSKIVKKNLSDNLGLPTTGRFWSSNERHGTMAYSVEASTGKIIEDEKDHSATQLLCVEK